MKVRGLVRAVGGALVLLVLLASGGCRKDRVDAVETEGEFGRVGEAAVTLGGLRLFYGLPRSEQAKGALPEEWNASREAELSVSEEPGVHRLILGEALGRDGKVYFCVATRYDFAWDLPVGVKKVAIEPGLPLTLKEYNPAKSGIQWRVKRAPDAIRVYATVYSLAIRYTLDGKPLHDAIPADLDKIRKFKLYYQQ